MGIPFLPLTIFLVPIRVLVIAVSDRLQSGNELVCNVTDVSLIQFPLKSVNAQVVNAKPQHVRKRQISVLGDNAMTSIKKAII